MNGPGAAPYSEQLLEIGIALGVIVGLLIFILFTAFAIYNELRKLNDR